MRFISGKALPDYDPSGSSFTYWFCLVFTKFPNKGPWKKLAVSRKITACLLPCPEEVFHENSDSPDGEHEATISGSP